MALHRGCFCPLSAQSRYSVDEVVVDVRFFPAAQQYSVSSIERAAGAADLLVVGHHRTRHLVMDHEGQVRLVETHAERNPGRDTPQDLRLEAFVGQAFGRNQEDVDLVPIDGRFDSRPGA